VTIAYPSWPCHIGAGASAAFAAVHFTTRDFSFGVCLLALVPILLLLAKFEQRYPLIRIENGVLYVRRIVGRSYRSVELANISKIEYINWNHAGLQELSGDLFEFSLSPLSPSQRERFFDELRRHGIQEISAA